MSDIRENMDKAIDSLKHNFAKVRTGRANANVLSDITVDYYGVATPITQVAAIKVPEAHMLVIELWDKAFVDALPLLKRENVRVEFLGDISALPKKTRDVFERGLAETRDHTGMTLALAVNYGGRAEITRAVRHIAEAVSTGDIAVDQIDDALVADHLYTAGLPDPELVIRTSGELRVSNYLLWQIAYSEFYITDTYWPDFDRWGLVRAIASFQGRDRRFGGLSQA